MEGTPLEGTQRVLSMFLNEHYPVLFIINKSINEDDNGETSDIKSTIKFLKNNFYYEKDILNKLKECNDKMKNYLNVKGEEEQYNKYLNDGIALKKILTDNNELFKKYDGEEYIIEEGRKGAEKLKKNIYGIDCFSGLHSNTIYRYGSYTCVTSKNDLFYFFRLWNLFN